MPMATVFFRWSQRQILQARHELFSGPMLSVHADQDRVHLAVLKCGQFFGVFLFHVLHVKGSSELGRCTHEFEANEECEEQHVPSVAMYLREGERQRCLEVVRCRCQDEDATSVAARATETTSNSHSFMDDIHNEAPARIRCLGRDESKGMNKEP